MSVQIIYVVGDVINGDYDLNEYATLEEAERVYNECIEEGLNEEAEKEDATGISAMSLEELKGFYYIKKIEAVLQVEEEIVCGGTFKKEPTSC